MANSFRNGMSDANANSIGVALTSADGSVGHALAEIEKHFHNYERWLGKAVTAVGETHTADMISASTLADPVAAFQLTTGNGVFGNWTQILGSSDTPTYAGGSFFDMHEILVTAANQSSPYLIQFASGESAGLAAKVTAGTITSMVFNRDSAAVQTQITSLMLPRVAAGQKLWARAICLGQNAKTIDFYVGLHEYVGG